MKEALLFCTVCLIAMLSVVYLAYSGNNENVLEKERLHMVKWQIKQRGIKDARVLAAMQKVERHLFIPLKLRGYAYLDRPLPIEHNQTISQPYIVAMMTELLKPLPTDRILEIGTGSGYQAAILGELVKEVYTIEIVEPLGKKAAQRLKTMGYQNIEVRVGNGYKGWPEKAPFDKIIVTAAPPSIPQPLIDQLKVGGILVIPVGKKRQRLKLLTKTEGGIQTQNIIPVRFVPMVNETPSQPSEDTQSKSDEQNEGAN